MGSGLWMICTGACLTLLLFVRTYSRLVSLHRKTERSFQDVERFIEDRVNLYAKWSETVAAYDLNQQGMLAEMMIIREHFEEMTSEEKLRLCRVLDTFYKQMTASAARCPRLRTSQMYIQLHKRADEMMKEMPDACRHYNEFAGQMNEVISRFPTNMTAVLFGFEKKEQLSLPKNKSDFF
ncbi:LemA family protein [Domibacillus epiphyticus]|uniref:LemA family protein n=1 Tax=Domibacillus epiphyticus TaxID=1714355 RepID=A0A1V2A8R0_9BACI|nr:LemA family protein [Domibacillus epiphyticus]OMP67395.1 hypothetical protein BTO28_05460 [Domibacillus epiphyticus]